MKKKEKRKTRGMGRLNLPGTINTPRRGLLSGDNSANTFGAIVEIRTSMESYGGVVKSLTTTDVTLAARELIQLPKKNKKKS